MAADQGAAGTGDETALLDEIEAAIRGPKDAMSWTFFGAAERVLPVVARDRARQEAALAKVRALHVEREFRVFAHPICGLDTQRWPCETVRILDGEAK